MSARMAAATGNLSWVKRYDQCKPLLAHTWDAARKRQWQADLAKLNAQTEAAYLKMRHLETLAIVRIKQGRLQRARILMFSDAYAGQQWLFEQWPAQLVQRTEFQIRLKELRGIILRLDEVLKMSARFAAATGNLRWEAHYRQYEPLLDAAIDEAKHRSPKAYVGKAAARTDNANQALVRTGNPDKAEKILFSDAYDVQ